MALVSSFEQRRQRERADEQASKILQELAEYDLAHSPCPVDRRRAETQAEARAQKAREAEEQKTQSNLMAAVERRIGQWFTYYFMGWDTDHANAEPEHRFGLYTWGLIEQSQRSAAILRRGLPSWKRASNRRRESCRL